MNQQHTLITLGGGGFSDGSEPELDLYVLQQSAAPRPRIGFIGTASGDSERYLLKFYRRFTALPCEPSHLPLFERTPDVGAWVAAQDIVYVGGGNTRSMLAVWRAWGVADALMAALRAGTVLVGVSAGAICWFEHGVTDSAAGMLMAQPGLGVLGGSCCPHYSNEVERRPAFHRLVGSGEIASGIGIDDGAAVHFTNGAVHRVVTGKAGANAYGVVATDGAVISAPLDAETLQLWHQT